MIQEPNEGRYTFDDIKAALEEKTLTRELMIVRIREAIATEESKPFSQRDFNLIRKFDRILYEIENGRPFEGRVNEHKAELMRKINERSGRKSGLVPLRRVLISVAVIFVLILGAEALLPYKWLFGVPSHDEQQYVIQGAGIDAGISAQGDDAGSDSIREIQTSDFAEVVNFLGYEPFIPNVVEDGWSLTVYEAKVVDGMKRFNSIFHKPQESKALQYEERVFDNIEIARIELEQNETGNHKEVNGSTVYFYENMDVSGCVWLTDLTFHNLFGHVSENELIILISEKGNAST